MGNKLFLIHWHEAEAGQYAAPLAEWGWEYVEPDQLEAALAVHQLP